MAFEIEVTEQAESDLDGIRRFYRNQILDAISRYLRHGPQRISRSRIRRLRSVDSPEYRLRVGDFRVFDDADEAEPRVTILRVVSKEEALRYLEGRRS